MNIHSAASNEIASRLTRLAKLYQQGQASEVTTRTLDKLIEYEAGLTKAQLDEVRKDLADFETRYHRTSEQFYQAYKAGETDDRMDFVEWDSLVQMAENLQHRLQLLTDEEND
ncbi:MAG: hypothetical protein AB1894_23955 [Chloroflexota bacterium]